MNMPLPHPRRPLPPTRFAIVLVGSSPKLHVALHAESVGRTIGDWSRERFPKTLCGLRTKTVACDKQPELGACRRCVRRFDALERLAHVLDDLEVGL